MTRGIRTLADLYARCRHDAATGCRHWLGRCGELGAVVHIAGSTHEIGGRRAALRLAGVPVAGKWARAKACCHSFDCVAREHAIAESRLEWRRAGVAKGRFAGNVEGLIRTARAMRRLTIAQAEAIRADAAGGMSQRQLGAKYGVSQSTVGGILRGRIYRRPPAASVWAWRPASNDERRAA